MCILDLVLEFICIELQLFSGFVDLDLIADCVEVIWKQKS